MEQEVNVSMKCPTCGESRDSAIGKNLSAAELFKKMDEYTFTRLRSDAIYGGKDKEEFYSNGLGPFVAVDSEELDDAYGNIWVVFRFVDEPDRAFKAEGYYSSYDGTEWTGLTEVKKSEKTVTVIFWE